jgi:hypothetical protein
MKKAILSAGLQSYFLLLFLLNTAYANFQQRTDIVIEAELIDSIQTLKARQKLTYFNNSNDTLNELFIHLWANAYKDNNSAFARQLIESGNYDFHFADENQRGGYTDISFTQSGIPISWGSWQNHSDIAVLYLAEPLLPSSSVIIKIEFTLIFPDAQFSRLGHADEAFYATQWYPKPAVYNSDGWHPMPYLHRGEFYSEFGNIELYLTLPQNFVVASTGILQTPSEINFIHQLSQKTKDNAIQRITTDYEPPTSSDRKKTLHFKQENVHDFAWFANKKFQVLCDTLILPDGEILSIYSYFTQQPSQWQKVNGYLSETVLYMWHLAGPYPWKQISAVQGPDSGGANMEYPAITIIGEKTSDLQLERVVVHEAIHNWFYGILGSNERDEPWIDEGFTTYYEDRFFEEKYKNQKLLGEFANSSIADFFNISEIPYNQLSYGWYLLKASQNLDQAPATSSSELSEINYFAMSYFKAAMAIKMLEEYLGTEIYDAAIRQLFHKWQFSHPGKDEIQKVFENHSNKKLNWFFHELISSNKKADFTISNLKETGSGYNLIIRNKGRARIPLTISGFQNDNLYQTKWIDPFDKKTEVFFEGTAYDFFIIDHQGIIPEIRRQNNSIRTGGLFRKRTFPELQFLGGITDPQQPRIYWSPVPSYNVNDGFLPGIALYNYVFPAARNDFFLMPLYSTQRDALAGTAWFFHEYYPSGNIFHSLRAGTRIKSYGLSKGSLPRAFTQIKTSVKAIITPALSGRRKETFVEFCNYWINRDMLSYITNRPVIKNEQYYVNQLMLEHSNQSMFNPYKMNISLLQGKNMLRTSLEFSVFHPIKRQNKGFRARFFAGTFLLSPDDPSAPDFRFSLAGNTSNRSVTYDQILVGYNQPPGTLAGNQVFENQGAFKYPTPLGLNWDWLMALNVSIDLPKLPLRIFFDTGTYYGATEAILNTSQFPYVAGIQASLFNDVLLINFPVKTSEDIKRIAGLNKLSDYNQKITFSVNLDGINPVKIRRNMHLLLF